MNIVPSLFTTAEVFFGYTRYVCKFKSKRTFEDLKVHTGEAFHKGADYVRFYTNFRHKNNFLQIRKTEFNATYNEACARRVQLEGELQRTNEQIDQTEREISLRTTRLAELQARRNLLEEQLVSNGLVLKIEDEYETRKERTA